jgi:integrase
MATEITPLKPQLPSSAQALARAASQRVAHSLAGETRRVYQSATREFAAFCQRHGFIDLPAEPRAVALYIEERAQAGASVSSLDQALSAIKSAHELAELDSPTTNALVRRLMRGVRRDLGVAPKNQKAAVTVTDLDRMIEGLEARREQADFELAEATRQREVATTATARKKARGALGRARAKKLIATRDGAVLLIGFASALRRSNLSALTVSDLEWTDRGVVLHIRRSKTDQEGAGRRLAVPKGRHLCPPSALRRWLTEADITTGPVFRAIDRHGNLTSNELSRHSIGNIVKQAAARAGLNDRRYGGHSLRAGLATEAARARKPLHSIMKTTGHASTDMALRYVREAELFDDLAVEGLL